MGGLGSGKTKAASGKSRVALSTGVVADRGETGIPRVGAATGRMR